MRIKLMLVAALAFRPKLLVLDEPFSGLDPLVRDDLIESVLSYAEDLTIFVSSHELNEIESFVSDIGFLDHALERRQALGRFQIKRHAALVAMQVLKVGAVAGAAGIFAPGERRGQLDFDHVGAPIGELAGSGRAGPHPGEIKDGEALERRRRAGKGHGVASSERSIERLRGR